MSWLSNRGLGWAGKQVVMSWCLFKGVWQGLAVFVKPLFCCYASRACYVAHINRSSSTSIPG